MKSAIFWDVTPCRPLKVNRRLATRFHAFFLLALFLDPEDLGDIFLRNVACLSTDYTVYISEDGTLQFFCCCMCISCRGNVSTEPLPNNDKGTHTQTYRLMGDIYEVSLWDGLRCHDIHKDWLRHSRIDRGGEDSQTHIEHAHLVILLILLAQVPYFEKLM
jgi:hypothetical protein